MNIIKIEQYENGSHANQFNASVCPSGWAIIPQSMTIPQSFPFVDLVVDGNTVTEMTERDVPEPEPIEILPTTEERIAELETENANLKEQVTNLEDCILEIADVVYA